MLSVPTAQTYRNVMESLVVEEVERQFKLIPSKIANYINKTEVIAYALNRLPALYATSEKGWQQQRLKANRDMHPQISSAVRQAIVAIQRDPLRSAPPLRMDENRDSRAALSGLRDLLHREDLGWDNLVDCVESTLVRTARGEITWRKRGNNLAESHDWRNDRYIL
jgi:hypothetical protein